MTREYDLKFELAAAQSIWLDLLAHSDVGAELRANNDNGFYLCERHIQELRPRLVSLVGSVGAMVDIFHFAGEKATRLISHPDHVLSSQSRNEENEQYGGAVRVDEYIVSISGLPEALDEVVAAMIHRACGRLTPEQVWELLEGNPYRDRLGKDFICQFPVVPE